MLLLPDHPTPVELKTHTTDSVPYLLVDSAVDGPGGAYTEPATAGCTAVPGHELMGRLVRRSLGERSLGRDAEGGPVEAQDVPGGAVERRWSMRRQRHVRSLPAARVASAPGGPVAPRARSRSG